MYYIYNIIKINFEVLSEQRKTTGNCDLKGSWDVLSNIYMRRDSRHAHSFVYLIFPFIQFHCTVAPCVSHYALDVLITVLFSCHDDKVGDSVYFFERPISCFYLSERVSEPLLCLSHSSHTRHF